MARKPIRVLVVDDSALMRKLLVKMLEATEDVEVVGTAMDGVFALDKVERLKPDVVTLDLDMPRMDGLTALRQIVERFRLPVVLVSSHTAKGAAVTFEALAAGGVDFVTKPERILSASLETLGSELVEKIRVAAGISVRKLRRLSQPPERSSDVRQAPAEQQGEAELVVAIGVSTGGPNALSYLLPQIRSDFPASLLIVQHMPEGFTAKFAERLDSLSAIDVCEAAEGDRVMPGRALIAPGGRHLKVKRTGETPVAMLSKSPPAHGLRPSADVLFDSVAREYGGRAVGLIMTGMGEDGAEGLLAIRAAGGHTLAQDRESSVVYGMPGAAIDRGAVEKVLSLSEIGDYLNTLDMELGGGHEEQRRVSRRLSKTLALWWWTTRSSPAATWKKCWWHWVENPPGSPPTGARRSRST